LYWTPFSFHFLLTTNDWGVHFPRQFQRLVSDWTTKLTEFSRFSGRIYGRGELLVFYEHFSPYTTHWNYQVPPPPPPRFLLLGIEIPGQILAVSFVTSPHSQCLRLSTRHDEPPLSCQLFSQVPHLFSMFEKGDSPHFFFRTPIPGWHGLLLLLLFLLKNLTRVSPFLSMVSIQPLVWGAFFF